MNDDLTIFDFCVTEPRRGVLQISDERWEDVLERPIPFCFHDTGLPITQMGMII